MAKTYRKFKKKKQPAEETPAIQKYKYGQAPKKARTSEEKREYLKLFLYLVGWVIFTTAVYMVCVRLNFEPIMLIYTILGAVLFLIWLVFNGGFKKIDLDKYEKPDDMGYDEFCAFIDKLKERQKKSKYFLILFIPFPLIMLADYIIIVWGDKLSG